MTSDFYLFIPKRHNSISDLSSIELSWVYKDSQNELKLAQGLLDDAAIASAGQHMTVVLAGEDVLFLNAEVPGKNIQRIQQAIPYVLEDSLIDDVDNLYFAINKFNEDPLDNNYNVSVINKEYFKTIIKQLENVGIYADAMVADYFLLNNNMLLSDGKRIISNTSDTKCSSAAEAVNILEKINVAEDDTIRVIYCSGTTTKIIDPEKLEKNINLKEESCDNPIQLCLIMQSSKNKAINLLQGEHKKKKNWSKTGKTWLPVAVLFFVWLSVKGGMFIVDYISLSNKNKQLNAEIVEIYKKTFPKSRRIINAKVQMQQKLASLKKRKGQSGRSFSEMLSRSAAAFSTTNGLKIKSLRYYDGRINLEIQIANLQALDNLKEQLYKENGYQVEIQNASSGKNIVTARIQITGVK